MTPVVREGFRLGVPRAGWWREVLNTDSAIYDGSNVGNSGGLASEPVGAHGHAASIVLRLPPLATVIFQLAN
jgi:1,4-alpha-glucan branching enzyme